MDNSLHPVATFAAWALPWLLRAAALQAGDADRGDGNRCRLLERPFRRKQRQNAACGIKSKGATKCNWRRRAWWRAHAGSWGGFGWVRRTGWGRGGGPRREEQRPGSSCLRAIKYKCYLARGAGERNGFKIQFYTHCVLSKYYFSYLKYSN